MNSDEIVSPDNKNAGQSMLRIVGYARESTREQAEDGFNLDEQERRIREYLEVYYEGQEYKFDMVREEGASGRSLCRPQMSELIQKVENGEIDVLIIHNLDRLTRNLADLQDLLDLFERTGVKLISIKENVETQTVQGKVFISIIVLIAQWEEDIIADRTRRGMQESARQGNYAKPKVPFGYYRNPDDTHKLLIDREQAEVVRFIFTSIANKTQTPFTVAKKLRKENVFNRKWTDATVLAIVQNRAYYGTFAWHQEMYADHTPAIVDEELWDKANANATGRDFRKFHYLFKGKVWCDSCGCECEHTSTTKSNGITYLYYRCPTCHTYMNESRIIHFIGDSLDDMVRTHYIYEDLRKPKKRYQLVSDEMRELIYGYSYRSLDEDYYRKMMEIYSEEKKELEETISKRKQEIQNMIFFSQSADEQKAMIRAYIDHINVDYMMNTVEPIYTSEYERIQKYVF